MVWRARACRGPGAAVALAILVAACGQPARRVLTEPTTSTPTAEVSPTSSPSPSPTASPNPSPTGWATYTDPKGRFSFSYSASLRLTASSDASSVRAENYDPNRDVYVWQPGDVKIEVSVGPTEQFAPLKNPRATTVDGQPADYVTYRAGSAELAKQPGLQLFAGAFFTRGTTGYAVGVYSANDPPDAELELFWDVLASFRVLK